MEERCRAATTKMGLWERRWGQELPPSARSRLCARLARPELPVCQAGLHSSHVSYHHFSPHHPSSTLLSRYWPHLTDENT